MKISPFTQVGNVAFGIEPDALIELAGQPHSQRVNRNSHMEFDYGSVIYRFDTASMLVEITADIPAIELYDHLIAFSDLAAHVHEHDKSAFERVGFLVSPSFGIAHDPYYPSWVTAFPKQSIALWQAIGGSSVGA